MYPPHHPLTPPACTSTRTAVTPTLPPPPPSQLLAMLEARTLEARTSVAETTKAAHAHRLQSSEHSQSIENVQGKLDALRQNLESEKKTVRFGVWGGALWVLGFRVWSMRSRRVAPL